MTIEVLPVEEDTLAILCPLCDVALDKYHFRKGTPVYLTSNYGLYDIKPSTLLKCPLCKEGYQVETVDKQRNLVIAHVM